MSLSIQILNILLFLGIKSGLSLGIDNKRVDSIENGWVELTNSPLSPIKTNNSHKFVAKCNREYFLNSNTSQVLPIKLHQTTTQNNWIPLNDYLIPKIPRLCARVCQFQSSLSNGFIQIKGASSSPPQASPISNDTLQVYENSKVAFKCFEGYQIRSVSYTHLLKANDKYDVTSVVVVPKGMVLVETCGLDGMKSMHSNRKNKTSIIHQCFKYCSLFQKDFSGMSGFMVPVRQRYSPGDQMKLLCNEGYIAELPVFGSEELKLNNVHTLECSMNGTWQLVGDSERSNDPRKRYFETGFTNPELKKLAKCSSVESFLAEKQEKVLKNNISDWFSSSLSYNDFNIRTLSILFAISGCIIALLITSVATMRLYNRKNRHLELYSPQLDQLLFPSNDSSNFTNTQDSRSRPQALVRSRSRSQTHQGSQRFGSIGSSTDLNRFNNQPDIGNCIPLPPPGLVNAYLPSYEEALLQQPMTTYAQTNNNPIVLPVITSQEIQMPDNTTGISQQATTSSKNELVINETTSIIEIAPSTLHSLGLSSQIRNRSRSGSVRSNQTGRSANCSIRTNNSIGTTNSNASFVLLPPSSNRHKSNIRARRHQNFKNLSNNHNRSSNRAISNQTVCTQNSTATQEATSLSGNSETNTILTTTTGHSSMLSNESNASVVPLRGSLSNVDTTSIEGSLIN